MAAAPAVPTTPTITPVRVTDSQSLRRVLAGATRVPDHAAVAAPGALAPETRGGAPDAGADVPAGTSGALIADRMRAVMALGPAVGPPTRPADAAPKKIYKIQQGDTLSKIASKMMNDNSKASVQKILDLNKSKISSPESLKIGVTLEIPS